jgi:MFS family permease
VVAVEKIVPLSLALCILGVTMAGPAAQAAESVSLCVSGVVFTGIGTAVSFVSVLPAVLGEVKRMGIKENEVGAEVSSCFSMAMNAGEIAGPLVAGVMMATVGFSFGCLVLAAVGAGLLFAYTTKQKDVEKEFALMGDEDIEVHK